jgi:magnesium chelatase accessory protein
MTTGPDWAREGRDWPNRAASRFVTAAGLRWHVQVMGRGPVAFLVHGTGAATHSWRALAPILAEHFTVIAPDLPGHGFTELPPSHRLSLPAMARALAGLLAALDARPVLAVGHSAGAAILLRMCLDGLIAPARVVSLNGALLPLGGVAGQVFSPVAKLLVLNPFVPRFLAWRAGDRALVQRLITGTGSTLEPADLERYARLFGTSGHVAGALGMMANWQLQPLARDLPRLAAPLTLVAAANDKAIPPADAARVAAMVKRAEIVTLPGLGHLAHEEAPERVAGIVMGALSPVASAP